MRKASYFEKYLVFKHKYLNLKGGSRLSRGLTDVQKREILQNLETELSKADSRFLQPVYERTLWRSRIGDHDQEVDELSRHLQTLPPNPTSEQILAASYAFWGLSRGLTDVQKREILQNLETELSKADSRFLQPVYERTLWRSRIGDHDQEVDELSRHLQIKYPNPTLPPNPTSEQILAASYAFWGLLKDRAFSP
jgi:hypothetical protein